MTDHPPELEDPELYWRRDVLLSIKLETLVSVVLCGAGLSNCYANEVLWCGIMILWYCGDEVLSLR